ncbi:High-affinity nicotinic acid transporter [Escovopsis weberi]|uniref:High-affinity nicotinic acid transporter n=1 Tax=Escovopsis weberi TaxID=150374 RepID=A0A0M8MX23_ESCWE|nr:High-affinity nicotinic acid transporter [Escovopsis weberi]
MGPLGRIESSAQADDAANIDSTEIEKLPTVEHADKNAQTARPAAMDPEVERRVVRKMDRHLIPLVMAFYLLAFLDRSNIGNARIAGMSQDLNLEGARYDWLLTIFYISYILFEPLGIMWKILPPSQWAAICVFLWGLVSTLQAATTNWGGEMALRFIMGAAEAGFGPGVPYLLSFFYLRQELGFRIGFFLAAAPLANTFAGALAFGITSGSPSIAKWRVLFLVEGLPTVAMALVAYFFMPDSPEKAKFLTDEEKKVAKARSVLQAGEAPRVGGIDRMDFLRGLMDIKGWITGLMYFSCNVSFASLPVFLPTILAEMGFSSVNAQGLTAPPFFLSFLLTIITTWIADRTQQRAFMLILLTSVGGVGYIILATTKSVAARYFGVFLAAGGIFPSIANILPWVLNNQGTDARRGAGIVLLNTIGQCGPMLGTRLYPAFEGPFYVRGQAVCAAFMFFTTFLVITLRTILAWENKKMDEKHGTVEEQKARRAEIGAEPFAEVAIENYGPTFRYVL